MKYKNILISIIPLIGVIGTLGEAIFDKDLKAKELEDALRILLKNKPEVLKEIIKGAMDSK